MRTLTSFFKCLTALFILITIFQNRALALTKLNEDFLSSAISSFVENKGQLKDQFFKERPDVLFYTENRNVNCFLKKNGISYVWYKRINNTNKIDNLFGQSSETNVGIDTYRMDVEFIGANIDSKVIGEEANSYFNNYYNNTGSQPFTNIKSYNKIVYKNIYNKIDLIIYLSSNEDSKIKYDFVVFPGGDPSEIKIKYNGSKGIEIKNDGSLEVSNPLGLLKEGKPYSYQVIGNEKVEIISKYKINNKVLTYDIRQYDTGKTLTIDPSLQWATYYGGTSTDSDGRVTSDANGNTYLLGQTTSSSLATVGSYDNTLNGGSDLVIIKFNSSGTRQWATYFGGSSNDEAYGIELDPSGNNVFIVGFTSSTSNVAISGHQTTFGGGTFDALLVKFDSSGSLQWSTYYGGSDTDSGHGVAIDNSGNVYLSGQTKSSSGVSTVGSFQASFGGNVDNFLVKFNSSGARQWGTYIGAASYAELYGFVDIDGFDNVYLLGSASSHSAISTGDAYQTTVAGQYDAYLLKFNSSGSRIWGTLFGGTGSEYAKCIEVDPYENIIIGGLTNSSGGIATSGAHQTTFGGGYDDTFIAKFNSIGTLMWGTYYGGTGQESSASNDNMGLATFSDGSIYFGGSTNSSNNIATSNSDEITTFSGNRDAFLVKLNSFGKRIWGSYYGGSGIEDLYGVAIDNSGNIYLSGHTTSTSSIASGGHQNTLAGDADLFLAKITAVIPPQPTITTQTIVGTYGCLSNVSVPFTTANVTFNGGNSFIVEASDPYGAFSSPGFPIVLGSGSSSPISVTLPYALAGTNYRIRVRSTDPVIYGSFSGPYTATDLTGANLANPIEIGSLGPCSTYSHSIANQYCYGNDYEAPYQTNGMASYDIYYRFSLAQSQVLTFSTCGSSYDTYMHLLDANGAHIISHDDAGPNCPGYQGSFERALAAGTYYLVVEGYDEAYGTINLNISTEHVLDFDGSNDNVELANTSILNLGTGPFTFEATIRSDRTSTSGNQQVILSKRNSGSSDGFMFGLWTDGHLWCQLQGAPNIGYNQGPNLMDLACHHVALTRDASNNLRFYVDGSLTFTTARNADISSTGSLRIGSDRLFSGLYFDGNIRNVRVWNVERTLTQIQSGMNTTISIPQTGLVGAWRMNEGIGQIITDNTGNSSTGNLGTTSSSETSDPVWQCQLVCPSLRLANFNIYEPFYDDTMKVEGLKMLKVKVFPNPFAFGTNILIEGRDTKKLSVEISSLNGLVLFKDENYTINQPINFGSELSPGIYILKISDSNESLVYRLVKLGY